MSNLTKEERIQLKINETQQKWKDWCEKIRKEIEVMRGKQYIYEQIINLMSKTSQIDNSNFFVWHLRRMYADSILMSVRRISDSEKNKQSISFIRLMNDILENIEALPKKNQKKEDEIRTDIKQLKQKSTKLKNYADQVVAHLDDKFNAEDLDNEDIDNEDIDAYLKLVKNLFQQYYLLLLGNEYSYQHYSDDWKKIFSFPWHTQSAGGKTDDGVV